MTPKANWLFYLSYNECDWWSQGKTHISYRVWQQSMMHDCMYEKRFALALPEAKQNQFYSVSTSTAYSQRPMWMWVSPIWGEEENAPENVPVSGRKKREHDCGTRKGTGCKYGGARAWGAIKLWHDVKGETNAFAPCTVNPVVAQKEEECPVTMEMTPTHLKLCIDKCQKELV